MPRLIAMQRWQSMLSVSVLGKQPAVVAQPVKITRLVVRRRIFEPAIVVRVDHRVEVMYQPGQTVRGDQPRFVELIHQRSGSKAPGQLGTARFIQHQGVSGGDHDSLAAIEPEPDVREDGARRRQRTGHLLRADVMQLNPLLQHAIGF